MSVGLTVTQRRYVKYGDAHYGGNLVDGAYVLGLFGDVATEACIRMDGDEGLFASYSDVQFRAPVLAGDIIEATATVTAVGRRSRQLAFEARVVCRADLARGESAAAVLSEPIVAVTAAGTVVVPAATAGLAEVDLGGRLFAWRRRFPVSGKDRGRSVFRGNSGQLGLPGCSAEAGCSVQMGRAG